MHLSVSCPVFLNSAARDRLRLMFLRAWHHAAAKQAGDKIMEIYNSPDFAEKIKDPKSDGSPLTVADLEANKIICDGLKKL